MASQPSYYDILGIQKTATTDEVKKAYKKLAIMWHPDKHLNDKEQAEKKFKEISEAYQVLSDPKTRETYDRYGKDGLSSSGFNHNVNMEDIMNHFREAFGGFGGGFGFEDDGGDGISDVNISHEFTLEELYSGTSFTSTIERSCMCKTCSGTGNSDGKTHVCNKCHGTGQHIEIKRLGPNFVSQTRIPCPKCFGKGNDNIIVAKCRKCTGTGALRESIDVEFKVKPGMSNGDVVEVENMGHEIPEKDPSSHITRTSVILHVKEKPHPVYSRMCVIHEKKNVPDPADLLMEYTISLADSLCDLQKKIPHISGKPIPVRYDGTIKDGDMLVVPDCGMPVVDEKDQFGDLYLRIKVDMPKLDAKTKAGLYTLLTGVSYKIKEYNNEKIIDIQSINEYQETIDNKARRHASKRPRTNFGRGPQMHPGQAFSGNAAGCRQM